MQKELEANKCILANCLIVWIVFEGLEKVGMDFGMFALDDGERHHG